MKSRPSTALSRRSLFGVETIGLPAAVISARTWPSPGVSISSASTDTGSSPKYSGRPRTRLCQRPKRTPRPLPPAPAEFFWPAAARGEERAALAVEVAGQHVEHVHQPARVRPELLRAGADPRVHRGALGAPRARAPCAGSRRPRCRTRPPPSRAGSRAPARATSSSPFTCSASAPGSSSPSSTIVQAIAASSSASVPGRMKWCSSASSAVRVRRGSMTTTLPPRSRMARSRPRMFGRGQQAAVRDERVRAQEQQVVAPVHVRDRHGQHRAEHVAGRDLLRHLVDRRSRVDVLACRARAATPARA